MQAFHRFLLGCTAIGMALASSPASANDFPQKPITIVVPFAAGGVTDSTARLVANQLAEVLKVPVIVDNRPGAGASVGAAYVARAQPDGYTILLGTLANMVINDYVFPDLSYKPLEDFAAVHGIMGLPLVIAARKGLPADSVESFIQLPESRDGRLNFGTAGMGSVSHMAAERFQRLTGTRMTHIPYKGSVPAVTDLLSGVLDSVFDYEITTAPHIQSGAFQGLATTGPERLDTLPDVPTLKELGYDDAEIVSWIALFAPRNTPEAVVQRLSDAMSTISATSGFEAGIRKLGGISFNLAHNQLADYWRDEHQKWGPVVSSANMTTH